MNEINLKNLESKFSEEKDKNLQTRCLKLQEDIDKALNKLEEYKKDLDQKKDNHKELLQLKADWKAMCRKYNMGNDFDILNEDLSSLKEILKEYENNKQLIREQAIKNTDNGIGILESKSLDPVLQSSYLLKELIESLKKLNNQSQKAKICNLIKKAEGKLEEELKRDQQLKAEQILVDFGKVTIGKKQRKLKNDVEELFYLINSSQTLKKINEQYEELKKTDIQVDSILNQAGEKLEKFELNSSKLLNDIDNSLFESIPKTESKRNNSKKKRKQHLIEERNVMECEEEVYSDGKEERERKRVDKKIRESIKELIKCQKSHNAFIVFRNKEEEEIFTKLFNLRFRANIAVEVLQNKVKEKKSAFYKKREEGNLSKELVKQELTDLVEKSTRSKKYKEIVDDIMAYTKNIFNTDIDGLSIDRNRMSYVQIKVKVLTKQIEETMNNLEEDKLCVELHSICESLKNNKEKYQEYIEKGIKKELDKQQAMVKELEALKGFREKLEGIQKSMKECENFLNCIARASGELSEISISQNCNTQISIGKS